MSTLTDIHDKIQNLQVEQHYEPGDIIAVLNIMEQIVSELIRIERAYAHGEKKS